MKLYNTFSRWSRTRYPALTLMVITLSLLILMGGSIPLLGPNVQITMQSGLSSPTDLPLFAPTRSLHSSYQNLTLEGEADMTAFVVSPDGSMTSAFVAVGDVGDFNTDADPYSFCALALSIFRWGDYEDVFNYLLALITNDTSGGGGSPELDPLLAFLDLLPPNAILMIFMGGSPAQIEAWGNAIHLEFETNFGIPFERITGIPPLAVGEFVFGVEAYGFFGLGGPDPVEIQGRDAYQSYMLNLGQSRNGASELVTPTLANDSIGGVGICGYMNLAIFGEAPPPSKSAQTVPDSITLAAWSSHHKDKFFGTEEQTFDVNKFCGRTGTISLGTLDAFEFTIIFPVGVNITDYEPPDMTNSSTPEGVLVTRSTAQWQALPTVNNIIVTFEGDFPPGLTISKTITPAIFIGGTATVILNITNIDPNETVYDVTVDDSYSWNAYANLPVERVTISGTMIGNWVSIAPNESVQLTYDVIIMGEGSYVSDRANLSYYDDSAQLWSKTSNKVFVTVGYVNIFEFLMTLLQDFPWSIPVLLVVGLMLLYALIWLIKAILGLRSGARRAPPPSGPPPEEDFEPSPEKGPPPPEEDFEPLPAKSYPDTTCINCGSPLPPGVSFCPACGAKNID